MPQLTIEYLSKFSKKNTFIETGTYQGDTVKTALEFGFENIHSIELLDSLYDNCVEMFKNQSNVKIWKGDSPDVLRESIIPSLKNPSTFWLDAHRSFKLETPGSDKYGPCPLLHELEAISESPIKNHVIFADDVRLFDTDSWDFLKKDDFIKLLLKINSHYKIDYLDGGFSFGRQFPEKDILVAYIPE